jgi:molybdopterin molybdotransferase
MLSVEEALAAILSEVEPLPAITVPLDACCGLVLAEDVFADTDVPRFDNSAVDGYAVKSSDFTTGTVPMTLRVVGDIAAGALDLPEVVSGSAVRIMTGAPLPPGADAVVMLEDTRVQTDTVEILEAPGAEQHVRRAGRDVRTGDRVLARGETIRPAEIAMLATAGYAEVAVVRQPTVAIVTTGDELVDVERGTPPPAGRIRNSNRYALAALVRRAGGIMADARHVPDDLAATEEAFHALSTGDRRVDVVIAAGGVSVGDRDFVKPAIERLGRIDLWRVRMKPGKPLAFGRISETLVVGLPGNPASAMVTFELFVLPLLLRLAGRADAELEPRIVRATTTQAVEHIPGRREYVRAVTRYIEGRYETCPAGDQGSAMIGSLTRANSLLIVPEERGDLAPGETVEVLFPRVL